MPSPAFPSPWYQGGIKNLRGASAPAGAVTVKNTTVSISHGLAR